MPNKKYYLSILGLIGLAVISRWAPHPPNFTPMTAIAIFSGAFLFPRVLGYVIPLLIMGISDLFLGFHQTFWFTYSAYLLIAFSSSLIINGSFLWFRILCIALGSSLFFFLWTNFGVWLISDMYPHTWAGLFLCYEMAIPFFRNELVATLFYTGALTVGLWGLKMRFGFVLPNSL